MGELADGGGMGGENGEGGGTGEEGTAEERG